MDASLFCHTKETIYVALIFFRYIHAVAKSSGQGKILELQWSSLSFYSGEQITLLVCGETDRWHAEVTKLGLLQRPLQRFHDKIYQMRDFFIGSF
jgi:hypothetical protein